MVGEFEDALLGAPECFVLLAGEGVVLGPMDGRRKGRFQEPEISGVVLRRLPVEIALGVEPRDIAPSGPIESAELVVVCLQIGLLVVRDWATREREREKFLGASYRSGRSLSMSCLSSISSRTILLPSAWSPGFLLSRIVCSTSAIVFVMSTGHRSAPST
jgi:hypothetical protein